MNPIIDPMVFYYAQLCAAGNVIFAVTAAIVLILGGIMVTGCITGDVVVTRKNVTATICALLLGLVLMSVAVLIPTRKTYYRMVVVRHVTPDNLKLAQSLADDAMNGIKADIIDIINGTSTTEKEDN